MKTMTKALTLVALLSLFTLGMAPAQEIPSGADLNLWQVLSSILYGLIGIALYYLAYISSTVLPSSIYIVNWLRTKIWRWGSCWPGCSSGLAFWSRR